ncbi:MAG: hypothetical protein SAK42_14660, partial [Oscillatoria sp. PMC 1076.18]|nr:hypothetical protein [Oscillatoria sp. PMC 1076.18]
MKFTSLFVGLLLMLLFWGNFSGSAWADSVSVFSDRYYLIAQAVDSPANLSSNNDNSPCILSSSIRNADTLTIELTLECLASKFAIRSFLQTIKNNFNQTNEHNIELTDITY